MILEKGKILQMFNKVVIILFLFVGVLAYSDDLENKMGEVIDKYMSSEAPFDLTGSWCILLPKIADAFQQKNTPNDYFINSTTSWTVFISNKLAPHRGLPRGGVAKSIVKICTTSWTLLYQRKRELC